MTDFPKIENIAETAKKILQSRGSHSPQAILFRNKDKAAMPIVFTGLDGSQIVPALRHHVNQFKADMYFFINDAWMRVGVDPSKPFIRASQAPDRMEVLIITEFHKSLAGNKWLIIPYHREGGQISFDMPLSTGPYTELVSHFNVYLETEGINERIDKTFRPVRQWGTRGRGGFRR